MSPASQEVFTRPSCVVLPPRVAVLQGSAVVGARGASRSAIKHLGQLPSHRLWLHDSTPAFKPRLSPLWCVHGSGRLFDCLKVLLRHGRRAFGKWWNCAEHIPSHIRTEVFAANGASRRPFDSRAIFSRDIASLPPHVRGGTGASNG